VSDLTFYFDPLCPWAWRTSRWIREVQSRQPLEVDWKLFSLGLNNNNNPTADMLAPLRALVLARREGGNQAVGRLYKALGDATHEKGLKPWEAGVWETVFPKALIKAELSPDLFAAAQADPSTLVDLKTEHQEAVDKYQAYGVPWLVKAGQDFGFNGPVISEVPEGKIALELWEHFSWLLTQPYFYEIKRARD
jgi:2-hydroxychromene-2-carboxylate isomerase